MKPSPTGSYYRLERSTVVDNAGDIAVDSFFTKSYDVLVRTLREVLMRTAGYPTDVLEFAWQSAIEGDEEALADYNPPVLEIVGTRPRRRLMIPGMTLFRGSLSHRIQVDYERLVMGGKRPPFFHEGEHFPTLGSLNSAGFVSELRRTEGELKVCLDLEGLLTSVPQLEPPVLEVPLIFEPFFQSEAFADIWSDEGPDVDLGPGVVGKWNGIIPFDVWFNLEALQRLCDDADVQLKLAPKPSR